MYDRGRPSAPCPLCGTGASPPPDRHHVKSGSAHRSRSGRLESGSSESSQDSGHYDLRDDTRGNPDSRSGSDRLSDTVIHLPPLRCLQEKNNNNGGGGPSTTRKVKANGASRTHAYPGGGVLDTAGCDNAGRDPVTADLAALRFHEEMASSIRQRLAGGMTSRHPGTAITDSMSSARTYCVTSPAARPPVGRFVPMPTVSGGTPTLSKRSAKSPLDPTRQPLC